MSNARLDIVPYTAEEARERARLEAMNAAGIRSGFEFDDDDDDSTPVLQKFAVEHQRLAATLRAYAAQSAEIERLRDENAQLRCDSPSPTIPAPAVEQGEGERQWLIDYAAFCKWFDAQDKAGGLAGEAWIAGIRYARNGSPSVATEAEPWESIVLRQQEEHSAKALCESSDALLRALDAAGVPYCRPEREALRSLLHDPPSVSSATEAEQLNRIDRAHEEWWEREVADHIKTPHLFGLTRAAWHAARNDPTEAPKACPYMPAGDTSCGHCDGVETPGGE